MNDGVERETVPYVIIKGRTSVPQVFETLRGNMPGDGLEQAVVKGTGVNGFTMMDRS